VERRTLGKTGLAISALGFGGSEIGHAPISTAELNRLLGNALDAGINVIDTAECYQGSETAIGEALGGRRNRFCLMTKCGHASGIDLADWSPALLEQSIDRSLQRLRTDHIDVLYLHSCAADTLHDEKAMHVVLHARDVGKVRFLGYSGDGKAALAAVETGMFDVLMTSLSIADQEAIDLTLPRAQAQNMGVVVKRPIANVAWKSSRKATSEPAVRYWPVGYTDEYARRLQLLDYDFLKLAEFKDAVSIALRFTLGVPGVTMAITGTTNPDRLRQNAALLEAGPLDPALVSAIRARWHEQADATWTGQS
jgi:aryl-alcohol dehydrogenase-like predicted oxidoreductase